MNEETAYWIGFSAFPGIGPVRFKLLYQYFGSARAAWRAPIGELKKIGLGEKRVLDFDHFRTTWDLAGYLRELTKFHVGVLTLTDPRYPKLLKEISDPPFVLYVKGVKTEVPLNLEKTIAVVGTRRVSTYGREVTQTLVSDLVAYGYRLRQ